MHKRYLKSCKKKILFIILPNLDTNSPIKGAIALANYLIKKIDVRIISIRKPSNNNQINKKIKIYFLNKNNFLSKFFLMKKIIYKYKNYRIHTLSFCFSADLMNLLIKKKVHLTSTSVRGNLKKNYHNTYGFIGIIISYLHYYIISKIKLIFSMNKEMFNVIHKLTKKKSIIAGNCIDENNYKKYFIKQKKYLHKIIFLGSLDKRKNPELAIEGYTKALEKFPKSKLIVLGNGPLLKKILKFKEDFKLKNLKLLGHKKNPINYLVKSDLLICTSKSEGISRSILEALFLGIPVMTSNIDGSNKIIKNYKNGYVFNNVDEFKNMLPKILKWSKKLSKKRSSLLPNFLTQKVVSEVYYKNLK